MRRTASQAHKEVSTHELLMRGHLLVCLGRCSAPISPSKIQVLTYARGGESASNFATDQSTKVGDRLTRSIQVRALGKEIEFPKKIGPLGYLSRTSGKLSVGWSAVSWKQINWNSEIPLKSRRSINEVSRKAAKVEHWIFPKPCLFGRFVFGNRNESPFLIQNQ